MGSYGEQEQTEAAVPAMTIHVLLVASQWLYDHGHGPKPSEIFDAQELDQAAVVLPPEQHLRVRLIAMEGLCNHGYAPKLSEIFNSQESAELLIRLVKKMAEGETADEEQEEEEDEEEEEEEVVVGRFAHLGGAASEDVD